MGNKNIIEFPHIINTCVSNKILKVLWGVLRPTAKKKILFPTKSKVRRALVVFLEIFH